MTAVLVYGGRPDNLHLAAGEGWLQDLARVYGALGGAGAGQVVQLVHEQDDAAVGALYLVYDAFEALLELAPELGARHQRAEVERDQDLVLERLGDVAFGHLLREPLDDGGLAYPGLADESRVVLGAASQDLEHPLYLRLSTDDGVELALAGEPGDVAAVPAEQAVRVFA